MQMSPISIKKWRKYWNNYLVEWKRYWLFCLAVLFVVSMIAMAASAFGGSGEDGDFGPGGVYDAPYSAGSPKDYSAAVNQSDCAGDTYSG